MIQIIIARFPCMRCPCSMIGFKDITRINDQTTDKRFVGDTFAVGYIKENCWRWEDTGRWLGIRCLGYDQYATVSVYSSVLFSLSIFALDYEVGAMKTTLPEKFERARWVVSFKQTIKSARWVVVHRQFVTDCRSSLNKSPNSAKLTASA